jgi:hypothetical protein
LHIKWIEIHFAGVCQHRAHTGLAQGSYSGSKNGEKQTFTFARTARLIKGRLVLTLGKPVTIRAARKTNEFEEISHANPDRLNQ